MNGNGPRGTLKFVLVVLSLAGLPCVGLAQTPQPLEVGETIRVWEPGSAGTLPRQGPQGFYRGMAGDTLRFTGEQAINEWRFPLDSIYRLEVQRGYDRSQFLGTIVGVAAGIGIDFLLVQGDRDDLGAWLVGIPVATGALGWVIGYNVKSPRWVNYPVEALPVGGAPSGS
jgi:hypothetical protein